LSFFLSFFFLHFSSSFLFLVSCLQSVYADVLEPKLVVTAFPSATHRSDSTLPNLARAKPQSSSVPPHARDNSLATTPQKKASMQAEEPEETEETRAGMASGEIQRLAQANPLSMHSTFTVSSIPFACALFVILLFQRIIPSLIFLFY
jgi:hypothetical protein